jgi:carboxymethylenebutenolidase
LSAYERYANALTADGIDAYLVEFYTPVDSATLRAMGSREDREAYDMQRYGAWSERVSSVITTIFGSDDGSDRIGLLGFSLGGFVAVTTASRDSRVSALAVLYAGMPDKIAPQVKRMPAMIELHGDADRNVPLARARFWSHWPKPSARLQSKSPIQAEVMASTSPKMILRPAMLFDASHTSLAGC